MNVVSPTHMCSNYKNVKKKSKKLTISKIPKKIVLYQKNRIKKFQFRFVNN